jgi:TolB-like protein
MTSSSSSSSRSARLGLLAALAAALVGPARPAAAQDGEGSAPASPRLALFPFQNLSGGAAPVRELTAALRARLEARGVALAAEEEVRQILAAHRVRWMGGLDQPTAAALRAGAGVEGVIIPSLDGWLAAPPCQVALSARLASTDDAPAIRWTAHFARTGDDAPGLLGLGLVPSVEALRDLALDQLAASLAAALRQPGRRAPCPDQSARRPRRHFRSPLVADEGRRTIAVLPFLDASGRREAGDVVTLRILDALAASGRIQVIEPGVVRAEMLSHRLGATGALALDDARVILELVDADLILSGTVRTYEEAAGSGAPSVEFTTWALDRGTAQVVWSSTSSAAGDDGVFFFGVGRTSTASGLACALAKGVVGLLLHGRPSVLAPAAGSAQGPGTGARTALR